MGDVVQEPIDDEQVEMHTWPPADFCGFDSEHAVPMGCGKQGEATAPIHP